MDSKKLETSKEKETHGRQQEKKKGLKKFKERPDGTIMETHKGRRNTFASRGRKSSRRTWLTSSKALLAGPKTTLISSGLFPPDSPALNNSNPAFLYFFPLSFPRDAPSLFTPISKQDYMNENYFRKVTDAQKKSCDLFEIVEVGSDTGS